MLSVKTNLAAGNANRQFGINEGKSVKTVEKLSSGYRINRSADDAAGLSISEKMRRQVRGLSQASTNSWDGISMVQTAEGALNEVHDMLHRANELAVKAANGIYTDEQRAMIDDEIQQLKSAIDDSGKNTVFNGIHLFPENGMSPKTMAESPSRTYHYELTLNLADGSVSIGGTNPSVGAARAASGAVSTGSELADTIANVLVPNAVSQILDTFPALSNAVGSDTIGMTLDVSFLDGPGNTLAYAQFAYSTGGGKPVSMLLKVDVADFDDADAQGTGAGAEKLESTLAHELMHTVMQYTMTDGMSGRGGAEKFPTWFIEGTAQLSGGGFPTGWNYALQNMVSGLTSGDTSKDVNIRNYLQSYTMAGRPYGHGYLGAAYVGYLANGGTGPVTGAAIASGMNQIFNDIINNHKSFSRALQDNTGYTETGLEGLFASGNANLTAFVRELAIASAGGAGSVVTPGLNVGGTNILGTAATNQPFYIDPDKVKVDLDSGGARVSLQVGGENGETLEFHLYQMSIEALGLADMNTKTAAASGDAIDALKEAIGYVSGIRSAYGSIQNRLEHTILNLDSIVENTTAAESRIRDTDMADEMVRYSNYQIILQAGQSMLTQANKQPELILGLLQ